MLLKYFCKRLLGLLLISFQTGAGWAQDLPGLFIPADSESTVRKMPELLPDRINVKVDFSLIKPSPAPRASVHAALPDRNVVLLRDRTETRGEDNYTWVGRVEGHELSTVVITVVNGIAVGHIDINGEAYALEPKNGGYQIVKEDAAMVVPFYDDERVPVIPLTRQSYMPVYPAYLTAEDGGRIDVLVLYTQQMTNTYGTGLAAKIQNFVDLANTAYTNSGINTQISMVNSALFTDANAAEDVSISSALDYITGTSGGQLTGTPPAAIQSLRETYKADMVSLLRVYPGTGTGCGLGWVMQSVSSTFADYAFSVSEVKDSGSGGYYCDSRTFAHELGHNMGCAHDRAHASQTGAYSYSYGYGISGTFGTVMSYISPRITYFSTPLVTYSGYPIGKDETQADSAYNAKTINNTRTTVANFRVAAATITCTYTISPASQTFTSAGGTGSVTVTASASSCSWTASSSLSWVTITTAGGTGSGTAAFSVSANTTGTTRTGNITVAGQTFTITQSSGSQTVLLVTASSSQTYFDTIQAAYDANTGAAGSSILIQGVTLTETLLFNQNNTISLTGGYDASFSTVGATMTTVHGSLTISGGTVTISNILIQ